MTRHAPATAPLDDAQIIGGGAACTLAIAAPDVAAQVAIEQTARALGLEVLASGNGPSALDRARRALRMTQPPTVIVHGAAGAEALVAAAAAVSPRPVLILIGAGAIDVAAARAAALDVELIAVAPYTIDRLGPVLLAAARLAFERAALQHARAAEHLLRRRLDQLVATDEHSGLHGLELVRRVVELELRRGKRYGYPVALTMIELAGVRHGDGGIQRILHVRAAAALTSAVRDMDLACELEDGRYMVVLPHTDRAAAGRVAHRLVRAITAIAPVTVGGAVYRLTARAGVAASTKGSGSLERLQGDADAALAQARRDDAELVIAS